MWRWPVHPLVWELCPSLSPQWYEDFKTQVPRGKALLATQVRQVMQHGPPLSSRWLHRRPPVHTYPSNMWYSSGMRKQKHTMETVVMMAASRAQAEACTPGGHHRAG